MSSKHESPTQALTKYPSAGLRELLFLAFPLIFSLFSASFMGFCDRLFLARYSLEALQAGVSAGYLCMLFQQPLIRIAAMAQVFVGLYRGSNQPSKIGESVWQMIWLCLFSMIFTLPASQFVAPFFFDVTPVREASYTYFNTLMLVNFLFPLGVALSSYFIGQGKIKALFFVTFLSHALNIGLDALFIFGVKGVIPAMGILGAALATAISQGVLCAVLFIVFLSKKNRKLYNTGKYHFNWGNFWEQLRVGLPRAIGRIIILTAFVAIARIVTIKGGDYLMVLSVGGTLILLFTFINDGIYQAMITIASNLMGARDYQKIWKMVRSAGLLLLITTTLLSIPYLLMPEFILSFFFSELPSAQTLKTLKLSCVWLWLFFFSYGFNTIGLSLITASRDVTFHMFSILFIWLTAFLPAYLGFNYWNWSPDKLWLLMAFDSLLYGGVFLIRSSKEKWKEPQFDFGTEEVLPN